MITVPSIKSVATVKQLEFTMDTDFSNQQEAMKLSMGRRTKRSRNAKSIKTNNSLLNSSFKSKSRNDLIESYKSAGQNEISQGLPPERSWLMNR